MKLQNGLSVQSEPKPLKILIVAAEASSSLYALRLLEYWQKTKQPVQAFGIGSRDMEKSGFEIVGRAEELAVVGLIEVLAHWSKIKFTFESLVQKAKIEKPDVVLLMDYPDFNLRLAKEVKALGLRVVYYISPQIWAWRKSRVNLIRKYVDQMIVLFPFEVDFYRANGIEAKFLGNPLLDEMKDAFVDSAQLDREREMCGIPKGNVILGLMPGSRKSELDHHLSVQIETAQLLAQKIKNLSVVLMVAPTLTLEEVRARLPKYDFQLHLIKRPPIEMIRLTHFILCASGTATLMVALLKVPMIIMYRFKPLTVFIARFFLKPPKFFGLPNLIMDKMIVPEIFQEEANPANLATECAKFLNSAESRNQKSDELGELYNRLGQQGATERVAQTILEIARR